MRCSHHVAGLVAFPVLILMIALHSSGGAAATHSADRLARQDPADGQPPARADRRGPRGPLPTWAAQSWLFRRHIEPPLVLTGANVIDVRTGDVREGVNIEIAGDVIRSITTDDPPDGATVLPLDGRFVIPGLFDLHAHVIPPHPAYPDALTPEQTLNRLLRHGVTAIRCLPFTSESAAAWAAQTASGELPGPTIIYASPIFEQSPQRTSFGFGDPETAAAWVEREAMLGARWIKVYNRMDEPSLEAIVTTAHAHGMRVCGHTADVPPHRAAAIGMDCIEHITGIPRSCQSDDATWPERGRLFDQVAGVWRNVDPQRASELLETLLEHDTAWVPTLVVIEAIAERGEHDDEPAFQGGDAGPLLEALRRGAELAVQYHRMGGPVGLGTDFPVDGVTPGDSAHRELELLVEFGGATPLEALQIGTISSARILGFEALVGAVEPGMTANLIVLDANPLVDISNVRAIHRIIHDGRVYEP